MFKTPWLYHKCNLISLLPSVLSPSVSHGLWMCCCILDRNQALGGHLSLFYFCHVPHKDDVSLNSSRFCTSESKPIFSCFLLKNLIKRCHFFWTHPSIGQHHSVIKVKDRNGIRWTLIIEKSNIQNDSVFFFSGMSTKISSFFSCYLTENRCFFVNPTFLLVYLQGFFHIICKLQLSLSQNGQFVGMDPTMQRKMKMYLHFD